MYLKFLKREVMECFVKEKEAFINHMMENDLLSTKQYGFMQGRSTTQLLST